MGNTPPTSRRSSQQNINRTPNQGSTYNTLEPQSHQYADQIAKATAELRAALSSIPSAGDATSGTDLGTNSNQAVNSTMSVADLASKLDELKTNSPKEINILLLGETGAGKSTFINAVFNYLQFANFETAEKEHLNVLIPACFTIEDKNGIIRTVEVGAKDDNNEVLVTGSSATQGVKTYSFYIKGGQTLVRLIDTPGMGDTRGIEADDENCENILCYLNRIHQLHAICYLTKAQQSRSTVYFTYCVSQILSRLEKSACKNIIFVFTHAKGSNYSAGETLQLLRALTEEIRRNSAHADIPLDKNAFCFDNEAFRALAAIKKGVELSSDVRKWSIESWNRSMQQCWEMIMYIMGLTPHMVHSTAAINNARRIIYQLSQPMADIAQLINDNIQILDNHRRHLDLDNRNLAELKKKLFIPVIDLVVKTLTQPVTVCTDSSCTEVYDVAGRNEWHYKTRCHDPCHLTSVPRDIIGSPALMHCASMGSNQSCTKCTHSYKVHMHVYYMTEKVHTEKKDDLISKSINTKELVIQEATKVIQLTEARKAQLEKELETIVRCNAKFAHFLQNNAIAAFSDSYAEYINYLMTKERRLGSHADMSKLAGLQKLLREHNEMKKTFSQAAEMQKKLGRSDQVTPQDINETMQKLFKLNLNGKKIKELFDSQKKSMKKEYCFSEYTHKAVFQQSEPKVEKKEKIQKKKDNDDKKGQSSNRNPSQKFQRGRPNNRGNHHNNNPQGGRGRSTGPGGRNSNENQQRGHSPPPPYYDSAPQSSNYPYPSDFRGPPYGPPPPNYRGPQPPYGPPPPNYHGPHGHSGQPPYPEGRGYGDHHSPTAHPNSGGSSRQPDGKPIIHLNIHYPPNQDNKLSPEPHPHDYPRDRDYYSRPNRDPNYRPHPSDPYYGYREGYPPYDYPYGHSRDHRPPPAHDNHYYRYDDRYHRDPRDAHPPPPPPGHGYNYGPRYPGPSTPHYNNQAHGNQGPNTNYRNQNNRTQQNNNSRGNINRRGINRRPRRKNNNANSNSGDESDTSVASSTKK